MIIRQNICCPVHCAVDQPVLTGASNRAEMFVIKIYQICHFRLQVKRLHPI